MSIDLKMVMTEDKGQPIKLIWWFYINSTSDLVYLKKDVTTMKLRKLIFNRFDCKKDF